MGSSVLAPESQVFKKIINFLIIYNNFYNAVYIYLFYFILFLKTIPSVLWFRKFGHFSLIFSLFFVEFTIHKNDFFSIFLVAKWRKFAKKKEKTLDHS